MTGLVLVLAAGVGGAVWWYGQDGDVQVTDTSTGGDPPEAAAADTTPTTAPETPERSARDRSSSGSSDETAEVAEETEPTDTGGSENDAEVPPTQPATNPDPGGDVDSGSPADAVATMLAAANDADCPALIDSITASSREMFGSSRDAQIAECEATMNFAPPSDMTIQSQSVTSETDQEATVETTYTAQGTTSTEAFHVVREDNRWKVDLVG